jgi:hypothetical protein
MLVDLMQCLINAKFKVLFLSYDNDLSIYSNLIYFHSMLGLAKRFRHLVLLFEFTFLKTSFYSFDSPYISLFMRFHCQAGHLVIRFAFLMNDYAIID